MRGYEVTINEGGTSHKVHVSDRRAIVCSNPATAAQLADSIKRPIKLDKLRFGQLADKVKNDLGDKLGHNVEEMEILSVKSYNWPDSSLGCPQPGQRYEKRKIRGWVFVIGSQGRQFNYHTDQEQKFVSCPPIEVD